MKKQIRWVNSYEPGLLILTHKISREVKSCRIDDESIPVVSRFQWHPVFSKDIGSFYIYTHIRLNSGKRRIESLHRIVLGVSDRSLNVDHVNHDTLDNRRANLRAVSVRENVCNNKNNKSGYPCIFWRQRLKKWHSVIRLDGKQKHIGYSDDLKVLAMKLWEFGDLKFGTKNPYRKPEA